MRIEFIPSLSVASAFIVIVSVVLRSAVGECETVTVVGLVVAFVSGAVTVSVNSFGA